MRPAALAATQLSPAVSWFPEPSVECLQQGGCLGRSVAQLRGRLLVDLSEPALIRHVFLHEGERLAVARHHTFAEPERAAHGRAEMVGHEVCCLLKAELQDGRVEQRSGLGKQRFKRRKTAAVVPRKHIGDEPSYAAFGDDQAVLLKQEHRLPHNGPAHSERHAKLGLTRE